MWEYYQFYNLLKSNRKSSNINSNMPYPKWHDTIAIKPIDLIKPECHSCARHNSNTCVWLPSPSRKWSSTAGPTAEGHAY